MKFLEKIENLPDLPGVYCMKNADGTVIYIGKANSIKKRVKSYFLLQKDSRPLIQFLVPKISDIEFIVTKNEKEALVLENTLIKKHKPKYNINLKDDKTYYSLKITTKNKFPRLLLTRKVKKDGSLYFGPYSSAGAVRETIALLRNIFLLRTCSDSELANRSRACLNYQIKKCSAPCMKYINEEDYKNAVKGVIMFLNGETAGLIKDLEKQMKKESEELNFENASIIRDRINAVKLTVEKQRAVTHKESMNNDIIGAYRDGGDISITVINVRGGTVTSLKNHTFLNSKLDEGEIVSSFIKQFYDGDKEIPSEIILNNEIEDLPLIEDWLSEKKSNHVSIKIAKRGDSARIMEMAIENAKQSLINKLKSKDDSSRNLAIIKEKLHLKNIPRIIECYDISNIMGKNAVGSKTVLRDGVLDKSSYRRYKIRTKTEADDYGMMYEVLQRRFRNMSGNVEKGRVGGEELLPSLILIDGGRGHLGIALKVMKELNITGIDVASIAKEKKLKTEAKEERVYIHGRKNPIVISGLGSAFNLLIILRDEAHRFAISYHKKLRGTKAVTSIFDNIQGIGAKKKELILQEISNINEITKEKLRQIKGLTQNDIANILRNLELIRK